jgi:hypothetical protein
MEFFTPRPRDAKKPKSQKHKNKKLRAKKSTCRLNEPVFIRVWNLAPDYEQYEECSYWWRIDYFDEVKRCETCHRCTDSTPSEFVIGMESEWCLF